MMGDNRAANTMAAVAAQPLLSNGQQDVKSEQRPYAVERLGPQHRDIILDHLRQFFFRDEPLNIATGIAKEKDFGPVEDYTLMSLEQGYTVGAVAPDGALVGLCINACFTREEEEEGRRQWEAVKDEVPEDTSENMEGIERKFQQIKRLLERTAAESDVFAKTPGEDRLMDIFVLSVDDAWRGKGIAKTLIDHTRDIARAEGIPLIRCICTSHFSAMAVTRLGFECVFRLEYKDVQDRKGRPVVNPAPPHRAAAVYLQHL